MFSKKLKTITILFLFLYLLGSFAFPVLAEEEPPVEELICQPAEEICDGLDNDCDGVIDEDCEVPAEQPPVEESIVEEEPVVEEELPIEEQSPVEEPIEETTPEPLPAEEPLSEESPIEEPPVEEPLSEPEPEPDPEPEPEEPICQPTEEICDGIDNDCDALIDEDLGQTTCGVGICQVTTDNCLNGEVQVCISGTPSNEICDSRDNDCDGGTDEEGICEIPEPVVPLEPGERFDPATAPSKVTIRVLMSDGNNPPFPVFVTFVGVGNKNFGGKVNANGELTVVMPQGRYYTELMIINTEYVQGEDGPSFFLEANEERDFGAIRLTLKSEMDSQKLEDRTLEENILSEIGSAQGTGKIFVFIIQLLMKILEEIRALATFLMTR